MYNFLLTLNIFAVGFYLFVAFVIVVVLRSKDKEGKIATAGFCDIVPHFI